MRGPTLGRLAMLFREPTTIPLSTETMKASLLRLHNDWETIRQLGTEMRFMAI